MLKKTSGIFLRVISVLFLLAVISSPEQVKAEESTSEVRYQYANITNLSKAEKENVIQGQPNEIMANSYENYVLVYQKDTSVTKDKSINKNVTPTKKRNNKALPKTGSVISNKETVVGLFLMGSLLIIFIWKRKYLKEMLLVFIVLGGVSANSLRVEALGGQWLKPSETVTVLRGSLNTRVPETIAGYTYLGYIHTSNNQVKPTEEGQVNVYYKDELGVKISDDVLLKGRINEPYKSDKKNISGYTLEEVIGSESGFYGVTSQSITYVYSKVPVKSAGVVVNYEDEQGVTLADPEELVGNIGDAYVSEEKAIDGYTFKAVKEANGTGTFSDTKQVVVYVYTKTPVKSAGVVVNYEDEQGVPLADPEELVGNVGDAYVSEEKAIDGYTFKAVKEANGTGTFSDTKQVVVYVYTKTPVKSAGVVVNYEDEQGVPLADSEELVGNIGDVYVSEEKVIAGYTFKEVKENNATGAFSETKQIVTYIYVRENAVLTIEFIDKQTLAPAVAIDLLTYGRGTLSNKYPNIKDFYFTSNFNGEIKRLEQGVAIPAITRNVKIGDTINVPEKISFSIYDNNGLNIPIIDNGNPEYQEYSGFTDFRGELVTPTSLYIENTETIIQYKVTYTPVSIPF